MATGVGMGFDLDALDKAIAKADNNLRKLVQDAEVQSKRISDAFSIGAAKGISQFAKEIANARGGISKLMAEGAEFKFTANGAKGFSAKVIDEINKVINYSRKEFENLNATITRSMLIKPTLDVNSIKELENRLVILNQGLATGMLGQGKGKKKIAVDDDLRVRINDEIKAINERLSLLRMSTAQFNQMKAQEATAIINNVKLEQDAIEAGKRRAQEAIQNYKRELDAARNAYRERKQMYEQLFKEQEKQMSQNRRASYNLSMKGGDGFASADNAIRYANRLYSEKGLRNINNMNLAIQKMQQAQQRLNLNTEQGRQKYEQLDKEIKRVKGDIDRVTGASENLNKSHKGLLDTSGQLARALAAVFSMSAIKGYVNKLMQIRGEFDLQQRSLLVLLQNKDEANALWDKTVALAVKSPYTTKQLVTATKQLAAYRVESEKLYETNKMLADVSIGLGVDMNRLILAFGQVKAANFLRGTELRQFSEAGVDMLDELAKRFTALEGRAVSVGEVFERVSKRMVSFADVEAVFKTITSEGGVFYQMQEKQSETLKGMMLNLKDSYELMLNDIGKSNEGLLKGFVSMMKTLADNWQILSEVLKGVGAALVLYKLSIASTNRNLIAMALQMGVVNKTGTKQLTILNLLTLGFKKLTKGAKGAGSAIKAFMASNAITLTITAIIYVLYKLYNAFSKHQEQLEEITKKYSDLRKEVATINVKFTYAENKNELKESLNKLADFAKQNSISVDVNLEGLEEEQLKEKFNNLNNQILNTLAFAESFSKAISNSDSWWQLSDGILEDFEQFSASAQTLSTTLRNEIANLIDYLTKTGQLTDELNDAFKPRNIAGGESELEYIERVSAAYEKYLKTVKATSEETKKGGHASVAGNYNRLVKLWGKDLYGSVIKTRNAIDDFNAKQREATDEFVQFKDELEIPALLNDEERTAYIKAAIDLKAFDDFTKEMWYRLSNQYFSVNISPTTPKKKDITGWMKEYNKFVGTLQQAVDEEGNTLTIVKPMQADEDPTEYLNKLKGTYERSQKDIEAWDAKNAKARAQYSEDEINAIKVQNAERKKAIDWLEYDEKKNKKNKDVDLMKERIRLIKEMHKEFLKLRENYDYATAKQKVMTSYAESLKDTFKGWNVNLVGSVIDAESLARFKETGEISEEVAMKIAELEKSGTHIRNFNEDLVELIKKNEAFKEEAYSIGDGKWTLGYGETKGVKQGDTITKEEADAKLRERLTKDFASELNNILNLNKDLIFTQEQYNSLLDLTYQGGSSAVSKLIDMARNVDTGVAHVERLREKIKGVFGEESAARFGEDFVNSLKDSENIYQRIALLLQTMNLTVNKGRISKELYKGMQARSDLRAQMFATGKDVSDILQNITKDFSALDITTKNGVVEFLKSLIPLAKEEGEKVAIDLQRAIDGFEAEIGLDVQVQENQRFSREIENLFGNYEMSLELEKLNIPKDLASQLFGVEAIDLTSLREQLLDRVGLGDMAGKTNAEILDSDAYAKLNEHQRKELADHLQKVSKMEQEAQEERLKRYAKFLTKGFNERINLKIQELRELELLEKDKEKLAPQQYEAAKKGIQEEYNTKILKQEWEEFEKSSQYLNLFDDIENSSNAALRSMLSHLESLKQSMIAAGLPASDLKEILNQIEKVEEELEERTPFASFGKDLGTAVGKIGEYIKARKEEKKLLKEIEDLRKKEKELSSQVAKEQEDAKKTALFEQYGEELHKLAFLEEGTEEYKEQEQVVDDLYRALYPVTTEHQEITEQIEKTNKELEDAQGKTKNWKEALKGVGDGIVDFGNHLKEVGSFVSDMAQKWEQAFGLSDKAKDVMETIAGVAQSAGDMAVGIGKAIANPADIGAYMQAASGLMGVFATFGQAHNKEKERQIEREIKLVERLQKVYEDLGDTIKNAYSIDTLNEATQMSRENLMAQINATERMIEAEKDKKGTDWDRIEEWQEQIEEYKKAMKELEETRLQELGAFASDENKKSGAEAFVDAWFEAYKQTGDGLSGLNEQFDEFFEDSVKRQMLQKATSKYLDNLFNKYDTAISDWAEGDLTDEELNEKLSGLKNDLPALNENLKKWAEAAGIATEFAGKDAELSGLSAGIQSVSEATADILASYMNSVRLHVADTNAKVTELAAKLLSDDTTVNPMLSQLQIIATQTESINTLLNSVITSSNGTGGERIKVYAEIVGSI